MGSGHQQEGPQQVYDAAEGQNKEGGAERDSLFIQDLESRGKDSWLNFKKMDRIWTGFALPHCQSLFTTLSTTLCQPL